MKAFVIALLSFENFARTIAGSLSEDTIMKARTTCGLVVLFLFCVGSTITRADIINIDLLGNGGIGLQPGSENPPVVNGGTGGEEGAGITFDTVTLQLTINIGWGVANGFTNLTGNATAGHIHGPTADPAPLSFNENAGILIGLDGLQGWNPSFNSGGFNGTVNLTAAQAQALNEGRLYINIHTNANPGGETRGYLIVPEPGTIALLALGGLSILPVLRRARK